MIDKTELKRKIATLIYSRVSGYYNPVSNFNKGKKEEFAERKMIDVNKAIAKEIPIA